MREKVIERKLVQAVKSAGGVAPKFVSPGFDGMPDRIVLLPGGHLGFVEVKATGEKPASIAACETWTASAARLQGVCP